MAAHIDYSAQWTELSSYFICEVDGLQFSCAEISGLDQEVEVVTYRAGDDDILRGGWKHKQAAMRKEAPDITFKKAVFAADDQMNEWFHAFESDRSYGTEFNDRKEIIITLVNENEEPITYWTITHAFPKTFKGPNFKADDNSYAVEEMVWACETIYQEFA